MNDLYFNYFVKPCIFSSVYVEKYLNDILCVPFTNAAPYLAFAIQAFPVGQGMFNFWQSPFF